MSRQPGEFVVGGWAHRVEGGLEGAGWSVSVDGMSHRIDMNEPSVMESAPRITVDGERIKPKLRLAYNRTSTDVFRLDTANAQLRLHVWAPPSLERLRRLIVGALRRLLFLFWMPHLAVSQNDMGVEWHYTVVVDGADLGTIIWSRGRGFSHAPAGNGQTVA